MNDTSLITAAWWAGHFWNPLNPDCANVSLDDVGKLSLTDNLVKQAVRSWQLADANSDVFVMAHHGRALDPDGEVGPATRLLAMMPRCPHPDYPPPPGASFTGADGDELKVLASYQRWAATGRGSWPVGCVDGHDGVHAMTIDVNVPTMPPHVEADWEWIKRATQEAYAEIGLRIIYVRDERSHVDLKWKTLGGSVIGLAQFNNQTCGDNIFQYMNPNYRADKNMQTSLHLHETGHNCNLDHTRGGIMNPSILRTPLKWVGDTSERTLNKYFGGEPIPVDPSGPPDDGDPPPPIPEGDISGILVVEGVIYRMSGNKAATK